MNLEIIILSEVSQTEKDKYKIPLICGIWFFKMIQYKWTYSQNWNILTDTENKLMVTKGETLGGEINQELEMNIYYNI